MATPTDSAAVRLAIIGCGGMARRHTRSLAEVARKAPGLFIVDAVCDVDEARARALRQEVTAFQAEPPGVYAEVSRLLGERRPEAVDIVLPHFQHHAVAIECLAAGAHVLTEKPLALTIRAGRRMLDAAARAGRVLAVAEQARRGPAARALYWAVNTAGLIGEPRMLFAQYVGFSLGVTVGTPWRHDRLLAGGGWMLDGEVHYVDLLRYVFGEVVEVYGQVRAFEPTRYLDGAQRADPVPSSVEDTAAALLTFASGVMGTLTWTQSAPGRGFGHRRYYGSGGSLDDEGLTRRDGSQRSLEALRGDYLASLGPDEREALFPLGITDDVSLELYEFLAATRGGEAPEVDGLEGLRDMAVCEAIYESSVAGRPVWVDDVLAGRIDTYQRPVDEHWGLL